MEQSELKHYGILGMKWGVRHTGKKDSVIKKGKKVRRIALSPEDPTYDNKKYVSTNRIDNNAWGKYLGQGYAARGRKTYDITYKTNSDLKVAGRETQAKWYVDSLKNLPCETMMDTAKAQYTLGRSFAKSYSNETLVGFNLAAQTDTGKRFIKDMQKQGYGAVADIHGTNTSKDPVIILDPDKNLTKKKVKNNAWGLK